MPDDISPDEARMRAALGLSSNSQPRPSTTLRLDRGTPRHRFVRDGEVAVTMISSAASESASAQSPRNRLAELQSALAAEQSAHVQTRRALEQGLAAAQASETKHAHSELAHAEALQHEQALRLRAEAALQQLQEVEVETQGRGTASARARRNVDVTKHPSAKVRPRRKLEGDTSEPEPVQWWVPGWKTGKRRR